MDSPRLRRAVQVLRAHSKRQMVALSTLSVHVQELGKALKYVAEELRKERIARQELEKQFILATEPEEGSAASADRH